MELKEFIKEAIEGIVSGILESKESLSNTDAEISPENFQVNSEESQAYGRTITTNNHPTSGTRVVSKIDFDIAVIAEDSDSTNAGGKLSIMSVAISGGKEKKAANSSTSRIKFSIPVVLPSTKAK